MCYTAVILMFKERLELVHLLLFLCYLLCTHTCISFSNCITVLICCRSVKGGRSLLVNIIETDTKLQKKTYRNNGGT